MNTRVFGTFLFAFVVIFSVAQTAPAEKDDENVMPAIEIEAETNEVTDTATETSEDVVLGEDVVPSVDEGTTDRNSSAVFNEEQCLRGGGTCLPEIECPHGSLSKQRGLCPMQQNLGVECCHGLSLLETRCQARGGHCQDITACSRALVEDRAEDCSDDKVCCVLVRS